MKKTHDAQNGVMNLLMIPENRICADCQENTSEWASVNLGIFICLNCSGIHRSMGTHISFVRSCKLDGWTASQANIMRSIGNEISNHYYEFSLPKGFIRPTSADTAKMALFIKDKYVEKKYSKKNAKPPNQLKLRPLSEEEIMEKASSDIFENGKNHKNLDFSSILDMMDKDETETPPVQTENDINVIRRAEKDDKIDSTTQNEQNTQPSMLKKLYEKVKSFGLGLIQSDDNVANESPVKLSEPQAVQSIGDIVLEDDIDPEDGFDFLKKPSSQKIESQSKTELAKFTLPVFSDEELFEFLGEKSQDKYDVNSDLFEDQNEILQNFDQISVSNSVFDEGEIPDDYFDQKYMDNDILPQTGDQLPAHGTLSSIIRKFDDEPISLLE